MLLVQGCRDSQSLSFDRAVNFLKPKGVKHHNFLINAYIFSYIIVFLYHLYVQINYMGSFNWERTFSNMPYIIVMCCVGHILSDIFLHLKMAVTYNCLYVEVFAFDVSNTTYESPLLHMVASPNFIALQKNYTVYCCLKNQISNYKLKWYKQKSNLNKLNIYDKH